jgi:hypothetical protein
MCFLGSKSRINKQCTRSFPCTYRWSSSRLQAVFLYGFIYLLAEHETCLPGNIYGQA